MEENLSTFTLNKEDLLQISRIEAENQTHTCSNPAVSISNPDNSEVMPGGPGIWDGNSIWRHDSHTKWENEFSSFAYISAREAEPPKTLENTFTPYDY